MNKCDTCRCNKVCDHDRFGFENCENYISEDCVEVVRCGQCKYWDNGRCEGIINGLIRDYTESDDYCSYGERKKDNG